MSACAYSIAPHSRMLVETSLHMSIPRGYYGQIFTRSGLASRHSIDVGAGVVDSGYRAEVKVILINNSSNVFNVSTGDRIAQMVLIKVYTGPAQEFIVQRAYVSLRERIRDSEVQVQYSWNLSPVIEEEEEEEEIDNEL